MMNAPDRHIELVPQNRKTFKKRLKKTTKRAYR